MAPARGQRWGAAPGRIFCGAPGIALVAPKVFPGREVAVVILAAALKKMRVIAHEHGGDPGPFQVPSDRCLPQLDGAPGSPEEILNPTEHVVSRRHAGEGTHLVLIKDPRLPGEGV